MLCDIAVAQTQHVHAKAFRPFKRVMQRCCAVDTNQQGWRLETKGTDSGCKDTIALSTVACGDGVYRGCNVAHRFAESFHQLFVALSWIAHTGSLRFRRSGRKWEFAQGM